MHANTENHTNIQYMLKKHTGFYEHYTIRDNIHNNNVPVLHKLSSIDTSGRIYPPKGSGLSKEILERIYEILLGYTMTT